MERFKVGDVVRLNSGGLLMTVTSVDTLAHDPDGPYVRCSWSETQMGETVLRSEVLPVACLVLAEAFEPDR